MDNEHFPHVNADQELYWRDLYFFNYHINHDKMAWFQKTFDLAAVHRYDDHFTFYDADHWQVTTTETGSSSATEAVASSIPCGVLVVTNDDADNDSDELHLPCGWAFQRGHPLMFEVRIKLSDVIESDFYVGFADAVLFGGAATEGFYFTKLDGSASLLFAVLTAGVETTHDTGYAMDDLVWVRLCAHYDGAGNIRAFVIADDGTVLYAGVITDGFTVGQTLLFGFGLRNGEAASKALFIDYVKVAQKLYVG